jgi:hypothetical protein
MRRYQVPSEFFSIPDYALDNLEGLCLRRLGHSGGGRGLERNVAERFPMKGHLRGSFSRTRDSVA